MFCCSLLYVHSISTIISMGKRQLVALLCLSSLYLMIVVWLFLVVPWVCLQFFIVVFPDHTYYSCTFKIATTPVHLICSLVKIWIVVACLTTVRDSTQLPLDVFAI